MGTPRSSLDAGARGNSGPAKRTQEVIENKGSHAERLAPDRRLPPPRRLLHPFCYLKDMTKKEVLNFITEIGIVPIVRTTSAESAVKAVEAIYNGGIRAAEITMTVPGAIHALEKVADQLGDKIVLGAGTVLDAETARACMLAGAEFFVTPALKLETIQMAKRYSKVICPGALTPTEVLAAWDAGADVVKIFPCANVGGAKYIKALKGPFPHIEMIPTGGVNLDTAADFLKAGACAVAVGGELVDGKSIKEGRYDVIQDRARQYLEVVARARAEIQAAAAGAK